MIDQPPEGLVRGCNDPISIGVLSDWIEEQYGIALDYEQMNWSDGFSYSSDFFNDAYFCCVYGCGRSDGVIYEHSGFGRRFGDGYNYFYGHTDGNGDGYGFDDVYFYGNGKGNGYGHGDGNGYAY